MALRPTTSDGRFTCVGTRAAVRFTRTVCYQDFVDEAIPDELKDAHPRNIWRMIDGRMRVNLEVKMLIKSKSLLALALFAALGLSNLRTAQAASKTLDIYFIDVEGGAATLIVSPSGESLLIDSGFPGDRDAGRIAHVALEVAGLKQIDRCTVTHWHRDHVGGIAPLAKLVPIRNFYHHGLPQTITSDMQAELIDAYRQATQGKSVTLRPGDRLSEVVATRKIQRTKSSRCLIKALI